MPVPALSQELQIEYLTDLLGRKGKDLAEEKDIKDEQHAVEVSRVVKLLKKCKNENEIINVLSTADPKTRLELAEVALDALLAADVGHASEHQLLKYATLLQPNPRAMKRFILTYGVLRAIRTVEGISIESDLLALWTVLQIRWPVLAERRDPLGIKSRVVP